ncbi:MAG: NifB/NifX family molybdenum-iron cluster-binding protein [Pseudomonadota bacterium]
MKTLVAVPSNNPGGLDAVLSQHFGHCDVFTVVEINDGQVGEVKVVPSVPHEQGGCLAPVNFLASHGIKALLAGGMGMRPLMGFNQVGIEVYHNGGESKVGKAVESFLAGRLPRFGTNMTCGGGGGEVQGACGNH